MQPYVDLLLKEKEEEEVTEDEKKRHKEASKVWNNFMKEYLKEGGKPTEEIKGADKGQKPFEEGKMTESTVIKADYETEELAPLDDEEFKEKQARADMANLSNGCFVYKIEFNEYPNSLEDLLKPTKDWPNGFYNEKELPKDPWGNPYNYKKLEEAGKNYVIWSFGPNGIDEKGMGDDIKKVK